MSSSRSSEPGAEPGFAPVVLVCGPEATLRDAALAELRERVLAGAPRDFNEDRFDLGASGFDPLAIVAAARTLPVMARARLVLVRGIGEKRAEKFLDGALLEYLESPLATTCLVLEGEEVDKRQKWVKRVAKIGQLVECTGPTRPAEVRRWIEARMRQRGLRPGSGAAAALFDQVGPELDRLALEIEKLALFAGERGELSADDVAELVGQLRARAVYELALVGALANHFRRLLRARELRPLEAAEVQRKLGVHPFAAEKLVEQARRFDLRRLKVCLDAIRRTDFALKGGVPIGPRMALERLVLAVCA